MDDDHVNNGPVVNQDNDNRTDANMTNIGWFGAECQGVHKYKNTLQVSFQLVIIIGILKQKC